MIPISQMNAVINFRTTYQETIEEREKTVFDEQKVIFEALNARIEESLSTLRELHEQVKTVSPHADALADSCALLKDNKARVSSFLANVRLQLECEKVRHEELKEKLDRLEHIKKHEQEPISLVIYELRDRAIKKIGERT